MKKIGSLFVPVLLFSLAALRGAPVQDMQLLSTSNQELTIEFRPQNWQIIKMSDKDESIIQFDRCEQVAEIGMPILPVRTITVGIPMHGDVAIETIDSEYGEKSDIRLLPAAAPARDELGMMATAQSTAIDSVYSTANFLPAQLVRSEEPTYFRNQRIIRLTFYPLQVAPEKRLVRQYQRIVVRVRFNAAAAAPPARPGRDEELYRRLLLNYEQAKDWRRSPAALRKTSQSTFEGNNWYQLVIRQKNGVQHEGIYKVDGETLAKAGVPLGSITPSTLQLFNNGGRELPMDLKTARPDSLIENPITLVGMEDGRFDNADYILFYGRGLQGATYDAQTGKYSHSINHFTDENIYWLTFNSAPGKRMENKISLPETDLTPEPSFSDLVFEEKEQHNVLNSGFVWFGQQLTKDKPSFSLSLNMPGAIPDSTAELRVQMAATTSGTHSFRLQLNGFFIQQTNINGISSGYGLGGSSSLFKGILLDGPNTLNVQYQSTSDISMAYVDWIEIEYKRRFRAVSDQLAFNAPKRQGAVLYQIQGFSRNDIQIFDVSNAGQISRIGNPPVSTGSVRFVDDADPLVPKRYLALTPGAYRTVDAIRQRTVTNLRAPRTVDYIIITADDFYQQAAQLESLYETYLQNDRLATEVVRISDVYNQFSWGLVDVTAVRDFLVYAETHWGSPRYVLLFGDGHFDYRNILAYQTPNLILPYETTDRYETTSRATDDWFTYTKPTAGMQMAIGRIPVQNVNEAQSTVDKLIRYVAQAEFGEWRKKVTLVSDDELIAGGQGNLSDVIHTLQTETLAEGFIPDLLDRKKIYLMEYPAVRNASVSGVTKPDATEDLLNQINQGSLLINYIGHGNDDLWSHERVLNSSSDFERIQNGDRMAVWVAATCEFAFWDQPQKQSLAERILNAANRGAVAMISSSRLAYSNYNADFNYALYENLFADYAKTGLTLRLGDAVLLAKQSSSNMNNSEKYILLGDPAMRLGAPQYRAIFDQIEPDSIQALSRVRVSGHVERDGQLWSDYDGKIMVRMVDSRRNRTYTTDFGSNVNYTLPGNTIFRGVASIDNGQFESRLIVPKDISYGGLDGRITAYFWSDHAEGTGNRENLPVGGTAAALVDHEGPEIKIHFGDPGFSPGDYASTKPVLHVNIADSLSGVNIAGDIGHQITLILDGNDAEIKDLTEFFEYDEGSYTQGSLKYPIYNLAPGRHDLRIKAWDNSNNSSIEETYLFAVADSTLQIRNLLTWPNPMVEQTAFTYEISHDATVWLKIFTLSGRLVRQFDPQPANIGFNIFPVIWDGSDQDGDPLANGVYLYKLQVRSDTDGKVQNSETIGKLVIAR